MELADLLGSPIRLKIICALHLFGPQTIYRLCRHTGSSRQVVVKNIRLLISANLVEAVSYGSVTLYKLSNSPLLRDLEPLLLLCPKIRLKLHFENKK